MRILSNKEFYISDSVAVAIGKFDGVHRGHSLILEELFKQKNRGLKTVIFTFTPSPEVYLKGMEDKSVFTLEEKEHYFERIGIDYLIEYPFDCETACMEADVFVTELLQKAMHAKMIIAGVDLSFGKGGVGNSELMRSLAENGEFEVQICPKVCENGREISSTYVRECIERADMEHCNHLLGRSFMVEGTVCNGEHFGRTMGFPTCNIIPGNDKILPPNGVYFTKVTSEYGTYPAITNIGIKPTVSDKQILGIESFLLGFEEDLYDKFISVSFLHFHRAEQKFENTEKLEKQIKNDLIQAREFFS